jgi:hypothetical protein
MMTNLLRNSWHHHRKFIGSLVIGGLAWAGASVADLKMPLAVAGDVFFLAFIVAFAVAIGRLDTAYLKRRAKVADEGAAIVSFIILGVVAYTCTAIFTTLNDKESSDLFWLAVLLVGAPLGWFVVQLNEAAHYSNLYYRDEHRAQKAKKGARLSRRCRTRHLGVPLLLFRHWHDHADVRHGRPHHTYASRRYMAFRRIIFLQYDFNRDGRQCSCLAIRLSPVRSGASPLQDQAIRGAELQPDW